jgi:hypothetical protein
MTVPVELIRALNRRLAFDTYRERASKDPDSGALMMRPSTAHRRLAWAVSAFALAISAKFISDYGVNPSAWWWLPALFCLAFLVASVAMLYSLRRRLYVSDRGLVSKSLAGREIFVAWNDIERVCFRNWGAAMRVYSRKNQSVVIPCTMSGTNDLEKMMREKLPLQVFATAFMKYRASLKDL